MDQLKGLHHNAYRCRDPEETRKFYMDFLELPLINAFPIAESKTGRDVSVMHMFFAMADGSSLAFFHAPHQPFDFKDQDDYDLHIALEVEASALEPWKEKAASEGIEVRGIADHKAMDSIYFRDPNGYVIELTAKRPNHDELMDPMKNGARAALDQWIAEHKQGA